MVYCGNVYYEDTVETSPGVCVPVLTPRKYYGDVNRLARRYETEAVINQDLVLSHEISIVADAYAFDNYYKIKAVDFQGTKWQVNYLEVIPPRLKMTIGGLYRE